MALFGFLTKLKKRKVVDMTVDMSWVGELVAGAEDELRTVVGQLENVYKDKLEGFVANFHGTGVVASAGTSEASPAVAEPVVPASGQTTAEAVTAEAGPEVSRDAPSGGTVAVTGSNTAEDGTVLEPVQDVMTPSDPVVEPVSTVAPVDGTIVVNGVTYVRKA